MNYYKDSNGTVYAYDDEPVEMGLTAGTFTMGAQYSVVTLKRKASNLWTLFGNAS